MSQSSTCIIVSGQVSLENVERDVQIFFIFVVVFQFLIFLCIPVLLLSTILIFTCFLCPSLCKDVLSGQFMALQKLWHSKFCIISRVLLVLIERI